MKPLFNYIKTHRPKRNLFDMSFENKLSCNAGELIPVLCQEVYPGDNFKIGVEQITRLAPTLAPFYHRLNIFFHAFYSPMRLVYDHWGEYINGGVDGLQTPTFPTISLSDGNKSLWAEGTLADYLGIPTPSAGTVAQTLVVNGLPFRTYQLIYNEYYRDQTLTTAVDYGGKGDTISGGQISAALALRTSSWEKDYFTSALTSTQRGANLNVPSTVNYRTESLYYKSAGGAPTTGNATFNSTTYANKLLDGSGSATTKVDNISSVDISVINLRRSFALQRWLERNAKAGARLIETVAMHFGIVSDDLRLQRPKYIGGCKAPITVSEVVSTVKETTNPQGTLVGHGISVSGDLLCNEYVKEHGYIMIIMRILPRTSYQDGLHRKFSKVDRYDWFWPEFENIGEQAILNKEIYYDKTNATNDNVFGYTPRYAEMKFNNSEVHGAFRSTLSYWHMGRIFTSAPSLNETFTTFDLATQNKCFAVQDTSDHFWVHMFLNIKALRPMQVWGDPI